jgi:hypothetical protein
MVPTYRTLWVAQPDNGVLSITIDAPPTNLIGPGLVRDLVRLLGEVESGVVRSRSILHRADGRDGR